MVDKSIIDKLSIWTKEENYKPKVGDTLVTTTSDFDFDMVNGRFESDTNYCGLVRCKHIDEDYSEYEASKCSNGGCYGYDYWRIVEILET